MGKYEDLDPDDSLEEDLKRDLLKEKLIEQKIAEEKNIRKEITRLKKILKEIPEKHQSAVKSLIENAAYMTIMLKNLQEQMSITGMVTTYQNGENQWGTKKSPEVEIYNVMIKNHSAIMRQLMDMIPNDEPIKKKVDPDDDVEDFANGRENV